jgi:hypothetical protein
MSRNAKIVTALAVVVVVAVAAFLSMKFFMSPPAELDLARSKASAKGLYQVSIEPELEPVEQGPLHAWIVTVATPDGKPVTDATLTLDGGMPQHGHGLPTRPQSAGPIGKGRYRIEGVRFNMSGWWVLKVGIDAPAGKDEADFNIVL